MNPIIVASDYDRLQALLELLKNPAELNKQLAILRDAHKNAEDARKLTEQRRAEVDRAYRAQEDLQRKNIQNAGELMARAKKIEELEAAHADAVAKHAEALESQKQGIKVQATVLANKEHELAKRAQELNAREAELVPGEKNLEIMRRDHAARVAKLTEQENALRARQQLLASRLTSARDALGV